MFKCKPGCKAECCGCVPIPKSVIKKNKNKIHRKYEKVELDRDLILPLTVTHQCVFLDKQFHCSIYKERPFICKIYGTIKELQCPYVNLDGKERTELEIILTKDNIKKDVDERFFQYEQKYLKGQILLPPFI